MDRKEEGRFLKNVKDGTKQNPSTRKTVEYALLERVYLPSHVWGRFLRVEMKGIVSEGFPMSAEEIFATGMRAITKCNRARFVRMHSFTDVRRSLDFADNHRP